MADRMWFKGKAALALDAWYGGGEVETNLKEARRWLRQDLSFEAIVRGLDSAGRGDPEFEYPLGDGALQGPEFETVTRQGYLEAIGLALGHSPPVPIRTFWMTGVGNDKFEMHISDDAQQVSVTLLVPEVDGGSTDRRSPESWVVSIDAKGQVHTSQTSGRRADQPPSARGTAD